MELRKDKNGDYTIICIFPQDSIKKIHEVGLKYNSNDFSLILENYHSRELGFTTFSSQKQLDVISKEFNKVKYISLNPSIEGKQNFIYEFKDLEELHVHFWKDIKVTVDFNKIPQLTFLSMNWHPKYIENLNSQTEVEILSISDYKENDLKPIKHFTKLKYLRIHNGSLKNLNGIENFKHLEKLELIYLRSLNDISEISTLNNIKKIELDSLYKLSDFSPMGQIEKLEDLEIIDCKKLASIKFVKKLSNLNRLVTLGTTIINDFDTTPAKDVPIFFGSRASSKYNVEYPEKEILN